jgi:MinD-like ATPase involved in chromosome partitioning or flagellar assembly
VTSGTNISVALALPGEECEAALLDVIEGMSGGRVTRRCLDVAELIGLAQAGRVDVAVIGGRMLRWDRESVARLQACDVGVLAMCRTDDKARRMKALGVDAVVMVESGTQLKGRTDQLVDTIESLARSGSASVQHPSTTRGYAHMARSRSTAMIAPEPLGNSGSVSPGLDASMVAVWGPTGAPGRTTIACGVAGAMARAGVEVLLIDADPYGGTVAQQLGLLDEQVPGVAAACRLAHHGRLDSASLVPLVRRVSPQLSVLTGLPRADRWPELRPASLTTLWEVARTVADVVVVDTGFCLEEDEELSYDTLAPRRNAATVSAVSSADAVVAIGTADPIGVRRLVRGLDELTAVIPDVEPVVVVNRGTGKGRQSAVRRDVEHVLHALGRHVEVRVIPEDLVTCRRAVRDGLTVVEAVPGSAMVRALDELAQRLEPSMAERASARDPRSGWSRLRRRVGE